MRIALVFIHGFMRSEASFSLSHLASALKRIISGRLSPISHDVHTRKVIDAHMHLFETDMSNNGGSGSCDEGEYVSSKWPHYQSLILD